MFVELIFSTLKIQVGDYLNPMENPVFQFPVSAFHSVKPGLKKHVLLARHSVNFDSEGRRSNPRRFICPKKDQTQFQDLKLKPHI